MRRVVLLVILALALPIAAAADSIDVKTSGGTITGGDGGLTLAGSTIDKYGAISGANLGSLSFMTAGFATGNAANGGTLMPGGTFTITGNGTDLPSGTLFTGTFSAASWTLLSSSSGNSYTFSGVIEGSGASATTSQITFNVAGGKGFFFNGSVALGSGDTIVTTTVPEPGTLGLLGSGLLAVGGLVRRMRNS
jgi:hypothetical protein